MLSELTNDLRPYCYVGSGPHDPTPMWYSASQTVRCHFGEIYRSRPQVARYAVAESVNRRFIVYDMYSVQLLEDAWTFSFPEGSTWVYPTFDAALMTAQLKL